MTVTLEVDGEPMEDVVAGSMANPSPGCIWKPGVLRSVRSVDEVEVLEDVFEEENGMERVEGSYVPGRRERVMSVPFTRSDVRCTPAAGTGDLIRQIPKSNEDGTQRTQSSHQ